MSRPALERLAAAVFPGASWAVVALGEGALLPGESLPGAVPRRLREFAAGRSAARLAMGRALPVPIGADRAPVWPAGVSGSITHAGDWALAVVGTGPVGIDLEPDADLPGEVFDTVLLPAERQAPGFDARQARLIFSAKECAYKAQYPLTRQLFGFETLAITLGQGSFRAEFQRDVGAFRRGAALQGRFAIGGGFILTGIG